MLLYKLQPMVSSFNQQYNVHYEIINDMAVKKDIDQVIIYDHNMSIAMETLKNLKDVKEINKTLSKYPIFMRYLDQGVFIPAILIVSNTSTTYCSLKEEDDEFLRMLLVDFSMLQQEFQQLTQAPGNSMRYYMNYIKVLEQTISVKNEDPIYKHDILMEVYKDNYKKMKSLYKRKQRKQLRITMRHFKKITSEDIINHRFDIEIKALKRKLNHAMKTIENFTKIYSDLEICKQAFLQFLEMNDHNKELKQQITKFLEG